MIEFRDHHRFDARDVKRIASESRAAGSMIVLTTEKDAVRLGSLDLGQAEWLPGTKTVLFPGAFLPVHVFEVAAVAAHDDRHVGVAIAAHPREVKPEMVASRLLQVEPGVL